jgi:vesicular inhibitory amino acid transporter
MANSGLNGTVANANSKGQPLENTPLLLPCPVDADDGSADEVSSERTSDSQELWQELEQPWPSTFERSIALLASPVIRPTQVELYTKSPKPGSTLLALDRRQNLNRGFYTPDHGVVPPTRHHSDRDGEFLKGVAKVKSLDFSLSAKEILGARTGQQLKQQRKAQQARDYRAKLLQNKEEEDGVMSPGYSREKASMRFRKEQRKVEEASIEEKSSFLQAAFNLANILMGVGLLGLPFVFRSAGWFGGFVCLCIFGLITWRTSILIGRELNGDPRPGNCFFDSPFKSPLQPGSVPEARMFPPISSFPDIARAAFGDTGCLILSVILYFELFSCVCIFFVTIGDHLHQLFPMISVSNHMIMVAVVSIVPTIVLRTPTLLSYLSMIGTFATIAVVFSVVAASIIEGDISEDVAEKKGVEMEGGYHGDFRPEGLALALGLVAYCFSGHAIVPSIYSSMEKPQQFEQMVTLTFSVVVGCCLAVAIAGYYMFGDMVEDQVTLSLEENSKAERAMKALTWLMVSTAFSKVTLTMFPLALGIEEIVAPFLTSQRLVDAASATIKLVMTVLALCVSIFVPSFSLLCSLVGMICTMSVSVIFPAAAHLKMFGPRLSMWEKLTDWFFVAVGLVMAVVGTVATI